MTDNIIYVWSLISTSNVLYISGQIDRYLAPVTASYYEVLKLKNVSGEIEDFVETHLSELRGIINTTPS